MKILKVVVMSAGIVLTVPLLLSRPALGGNDWSDVEVGDLPTKVNVQKKSHESSEEHSGESHSGDGQVTVLRLKNGPKFSSANWEARFGDCILRIKGDDEEPDLVGIDEVPQDYPIISIESKLNPDHKWKTSINFPSQIYQGLFCSTSERLTVEKLKKNLGEDWELIIPEPKQMIQCNPSDSLNCFSGFPNGKSIDQFQYKKVSDDSNIVGLFGNQIVEKRWNNKRPLAHPRYKYDWLHCKLELRSLLNPEVIITTLDMSEMSEPLEPSDRTWSRLVTDRESLLNDDMYVEFSPDGKRVAVQSSPSSFLWNTETGKLVRNGSSQSFSSDERASCELEVKNALTGKLLYRVVTHIYQTDSKFSPDGKWLGSFRRWERSYASDNSIENYTGYVWKSTDSYSDSWNSGRNLLVSTLIGHSDYITSIHFSNDGRVVTASRDNTARVWNAETGDLITTIKEPMKGIMPPDYKGRFGRDSGLVAAEFSPDGKQIITVSEVGFIRVWDAADGEKLIATLSEVSDGSALKEGRNWIEKVTFSPDKKLIFLLRQYKKEVLELKQKDKA